MIEYRYQREAAFDEPFITSVEGVWVSWSAYSVPINVCYYLQLWLSFAPGSAWASNALEAVVRSRYIKINCQSPVHKASLSSVLGR